MSGINWKERVNIYNYDELSNLILVFFLSNRETGRVGQGNNNTKARKETGKGFYDLP